jgi:hypothetical protein
VSGAKLCINILLDAKGKMPEQITNATKEE